MLRRVQRVAITLAMMVAMAPATFAQLYQKGDLVAEFSLRKHGSTQELRLSDFAGKIVFLEWFAWW